MSTWKPTTDCCDTCKCTRTRGVVKPPSEPLSELPASPATNIRTTSPGLLTPTNCCVAMMIVAKNDAMTTVTAAMTTVQKARGPGNFVNANQIMPYAADQTFCL